MSYRILTKNGVDNTNIDGARAEFFNSGMRDGIVRGAFTEGTFSSNASNSVYLDSCELRISGHRVVIDEPVYKTFSNIPANNTRYSMIAQISVDSVSVVTFSIIIQDANTELRKDNLYATETGTGIYQIEIGRFTLTTSGTIIDIVRTADLITGGGEDENTYIEIGEVTTTTLNEGIDAEVDVENVIDEQTGKKKTNFHFGIPNASGTSVTINGQHQKTVNFDSEPQTQINELKSTNSTQGKDIDDLKNETLKKPASAPAKRKVVGINTNNSQELIDIDEALSETSENLVQNKVVAGEIKKLNNNKQDNLTAGNGINIVDDVIGIKQAQSVTLNTTRTGQNDTVVEYSVTDDGKTWYRKWASGWKECGKEITFIGTFSSGSMQYTKPALPVEFSNTSYTIQLTGLYGGTASGKVIWTVEAPEEKTFMAGCMSIGVTATNPKCYIYCCGF